MSNIIDRDGREIERVMNIFKKERTIAIARQSTALDQYDDEMKEIGDLNDMRSMMEVQNMGVDHNIIRHTSQPMQADDLCDDYYQYDEFGDEGLISSSQKQAISRIVHVKKEVPNNLVKTSMRVALFGFLEASQNDEDVLEAIYREAKEKGGTEAEEAAENLFETQKANLSSLLDMLNGYQPKQSSNLWNRDPDYLKMIKKLTI